MAACKRDFDTVRELAKEAEAAANDLYDLLLSALEQKPKQREP